jgi:hypothetical protein
MAKIVNSRLLSDSYSTVDTSECNQQDAYDIKIQIDLGWFNSWLVWEGGIAFNIVYWFILLTVVFAVLHLLRHKFSSWRFLRERFDGSGEPSPDTKPLSWTDWLTLTIDEKAIGKEGATYLWFQYRLIQVYSWMMVFSVALITIHRYGNKLEELGNVLNSTSLNNIGLNGVHSILSFAMVATLAWLMTRHGNDRRIRTIASPDLPNTAKVCNRQWLKISGLRLNLTADSLCEYLKKKFNVQGVHREGIIFANDLTKLWPIVNQLKTVRDIKQQLVSSNTGPDLIQRRFWDKPNEDEDSTAYYSRKENTLLAEKDAVIRNLKFLGTAFIRFDDPAEAKATKMAIVNHQSKWFFNLFTTPEIEDSDFRLLHWDAQYAPPGAHINWQQLEGQQPLWKKLSIWLMLLIAYSSYIIVMAAPGYIFRSLYLVGEGSNPASLTWKIFILPNIVSFLTTELTDWVTNLDRYRHHLCLASINSGKLRSIFYLSTILYLVRMMAVQPLPLLFAGEFNSQGFRLECFFLPDHGSFIACSIIVGTASRILIDQTRFEFLWNYLKKIFTFRSQAERTQWRKSYRLEYDFASHYAELTSNFVLTCLIIIIFPVIGIVSWICSILIFLSDRSTMMKIYAVSPASPVLHKEPVNIVLRFSILSPLSLLVYRIIQLGPSNLPNHLLDASFVAPLCVTILCALHLIYAQLRLFPKLVWLRRWIGYVEDEEDVTDLNSYIQHEYDPVKALDLSINQSV